MELNKSVLNYNKGKKEYHKIKLSYDRKYLYYDTDWVKKPNISSHTLVDMLNFNKWTSAGKTILKNFGLIKKTPFDKYYSYRGGIAEEFAKKHLLKKYGAQADIEAFTLSQFKNMNQFPESAPFSGVLDLFMHQPERMPIEVKSKAMKDYEWIALKNVYPKDECVQGANQAMLIGTDKYMMIWVFISPTASDLLRSITDEDLWLWKEDYALAIQELGLTKDDFKFHSKIFPMDLRMMKAYREKALDRYNDFYYERRVKRDLFDSDEWRLLKSVASERK